MKRSLDAFEGHRDKQARRQEPVSCQFCRTKKLKCDRQFPCSNCRARKLNCVFSTNQSRTTAVARKPADSSNISELSQNLDELNARLRRVEELLAASKCELPSHNESNSMNYKQESRGEDYESVRNMCVVEAEASQYHPFASTPLALDEKLCRTFSASFLPFHASAHRPGLDQQTLSLLPSRAQAGCLFDYYVGKIVPFYHVIHVPTVRRTLDTVYTQLENNQQPRPDHVALLSTIFTLSAYFNPRSSRFRLNGKETRGFTYQWMSIAQRALLAANHIVEPTVETLQSVIMIALYLLPQMGEMESFKILMNSALLGAQNLSIHQLDCAENKQRRENTSIDWAEIEVKRRIWWHLVSNEWLGSYMSGPRFGTYMIDPKHMQIDLPTNVDDVDINASGIYGRPLDDVPTDMTYYLLRFKLSVIIREIVDAANNCGCHPDDLPYDLVLLFDKKINETVIDYLPGVHRKERKGDARHKDPGKKFSNLPLLRFIGEFCPHTKLTRLHRPYLARVARNPKYAYSRMVCLRSARHVIELGKKIIGSDNEFEPIRLWTIIHHFFVSVLVLVMDYSLNREEPRADERRSEILDCFNWLEACQESSILANRALLQLRELLSKGAAAKGGEERNERSLPADQPNDNIISQPNLQTAAYTHQANDAEPFITHSNSPHLGGHLSYVPGQEANDPLSQYNWTNMDLFASMDSFDPDIGLDESQFENLFKQIEESQLIY